MAQHARSLDRLRSNPLDPIEIVSSLLIAVLCTSTTRAQQAPEEIGSREHLERMASYLGKALVDPGLAPVEEYKISLRTGGELRLSSGKWRLRDGATGQTETNHYFHVLWLDHVRDSKSPPKRVWCTTSEQLPRLLVDYTNPYGFTICTDAAPRIGLGFFDDQLFRFAELNVDRPVPQGEELELVGLTHYVLKRFGDANWEPRFTLESLTKEADGWLAKIAVRDKHILLKRTAPKSWIEVTQPKTPK